MGNRYDIPCSFKVPEGYRRVFMFECGEVKETIIVDEAGVHMESETDYIGDEASSRCLDWIAESIMTVRQELGV